MTQQVGYWRGGRDTDSRFPNPQDFIDASWDTKERAEIIRRLKLSTIHKGWMGYSGCRICDLSTNGTTCRMFDGTWVFPEGYVHYIEAHQVKPPQAFIDYVMNLPQDLMGELKAHQDTTSDILRTWKPRMGGVGRPEGYCKHEPDNSSSRGFKCVRGNSTYHGQCQWAAHSQGDELEAESKRHAQALVDLGVNIVGTRHEWVLER